MTRTQEAISVMESARALQMNQFEQMRNRRHRHLASMSPLLNSRMVWTMDCLARSLRALMCTSYP